MDDDTLRHKMSYTPVSKYEERFCQEVIDFVGSGHSLEAFAGRIGTTRQTVYHWKEMHPEFKEAVQQAFDRRNILMEQMLKDLANGTSKGSAAAAIFIAKNFTAMRDQSSLDLTTLGQKINLVTYGDADNLKKALEQEKNVGSGEASGSDTGIPGAV
jgi:hypothetical protein